MVRQGVRSVVGSTIPLLPAVAVRVVEHILPALRRNQRVDRGLALARDAVRSDPRMEHPVFWGYLACFGDGTARWNREASE
jgi:hypothetical protein